MKVFDIYRNISDEIVRKLTPMTSLDLRHKRIPPRKIQKWKKEVSDLYFNSYVYLPQEILNELNCLHTCLHTGGKNMYKVVDKHKIVKCTNRDVVKFIAEVAIIESKKSQLERMLKLYDIDNFPVSFKINFQVRRVIGTINKTFEDFKVDRWHTMLKKETLMKAMENDTSGPAKEPRHKNTR